MVVATLAFAGGFASAVAPAPYEWDEALVECRRRIQVTRPVDLEINGTLLGRAYDTLIARYPSNRDLFDSSSPRELIDAYVNMSD